MTINCPGSGEDGSALGDEPTAGQAALAGKADVPRRRRSESTEGVRGERVAAPRSATDEGRRPALGMVPRRRTPRRCPE
jgi:hypothetical protein